MGTVEHFDETQQALEEIFRVLRPGGCAIIGVPNRCDPFLRPLMVAVMYRLGLYGYGFEKSYTRRTFRRMLERCGFEVTAETGILFIPGWLRIIDLAANAWAPPFVGRLTGLACAPFDHLSRRSAVPAPARLPAGDRGGQAGTVGTAGAASGRMFRRPAKVASRARGGRNRSLAGCRHSARISADSTTRGPGRLKYWLPSHITTRPLRTARKRDHSGLPGQRLHLPPGAVDVEAARHYGDDVRIGGEELPGVEVAGVLARTPRSGSRPPRNPPARVPSWRPSSAVRSTPRRRWRAGGRRSGSAARTACSRPFSSRATSASPRSGAPSAAATLRMSLHMSPSPIGSSVTMTGRDVTSSQTARSTSLRLTAHTSHCVCVTMTVGASSVEEVGVDAVHRQPFGHDRPHLAVYRLSGGVEAHLRRRAGR